jgi:hypothetical protein
MVGVARWVIVDFSSVKDFVEQGVPVSRLIVKALAHSFAYLQQRFVLIVERVVTDTVGILPFA